MIIKKRIVRFIFIFSVISALSGIFLVGFFLYALKYPFIDFSVLYEYRSKGLPSIAYDDKGEELCRFYYDSSKPFVLSKLPDHTKQAFIAAEDWNFYNHYGLSFKGILRSLYVNVMQGGIVQGASTITQQLVKMLFFTHKRTFKRKIQEQFFTLLVERQFSKDHILQLYLNHVYFGSGIYGVAAAAKRFWGIEIHQLTIDQSAMLAAIICSPGNYSPLICPYSAKARRNIILKKMEKLKFISQEDFNCYKNKEIDLDQEIQSLPFGYVKEEIRTFVEKLCGKEALYGGGLVIKTTINKTIQKNAYQAMQDQKSFIRKKYGADVQAALVSLDVSTGRIKGFMGGFDFKESSFNRVFYGYRQQGSVFKPLVYATGLDVGMSLIDTAVDEPLSIKDGATVWEPRNYDRKFFGKMTLARALLFSNNVITTKILLEVGAESVAQLAVNVGLKDVNPYASLALGCVDSTVLEVAQMFNVFANRGIFIEPYYIESIIESDGDIIFKHQGSKKRVITQKTADKIVYALMIGLNQKKKKSATWIDSQAFGKTGTTNDSRTCWFAASTPELTTVVYVGCDDNRPLGKKVFPIHTAYPLWLEYQKKNITQKKKFEFDPALQEEYVDVCTGIILEKDFNKNTFPLLL